MWLSEICTNTRMFEPPPPASGTPAPGAADGGAGASTPAGVPKEPAWRASWRRVIMPADWGEDGFSVDGWWSEGWSEASSAVWSEACSEGWWAVGSESEARSGP